MQSFGGQKAHIIHDTDRRAIIQQLGALGITSAHVNNGTYSLPEEKAAPAFLSAYKRVIDLKGHLAEPLLIAANSDRSMLNSFVGKSNEEELRAKLIPQEQRLQTVVSLASALFPDRPVVGVFYDESTPRELYRALHRVKVGFASLHKVGYGTEPGDKPIVGGIWADWLFACPLFNDEKPVMHNDTRSQEWTHRTPDVVERLTIEIGPHGRPYITKEGKLLFPVPPSLQKYADPSVGGPAPAPQDP